jgi:medium-chain acyl-[acyl-carrier-protein] hydrolase
MNQSVANDWLAYSRPSPDARLRLFCFPHAGLGASIFRSWIGGFGAGVDVCPVQLPGRETRQIEPPFTSMAALADAAAPALRPCLDVPFAFFGHSMGALVAFEIARRLDARVLPLRLFVSGRRAPHLPDRLAPLGPLDDPAFIAEIQRRYDGIPAPVLECDDLVAMLLPRLRADVATLEGYVFQPAGLLDCPISVFGGDADHTVSVDELEGWREHSRRDVCVRLLRGGHLFVQHQRDALIRFIRTDLEVAFSGSGAAMRA